MNKHQILLLGLTLACASAWPQAKGSAADPQAQYQRERAACMNGQSNQDRATCLKEAGAAYDETRRNGLGAAPSADSATQRCQGLPAAENSACLARMQGEGSTSGTAASGGVLRELEQPVAAEPAK